jgi:iron only hydrogenase large subunit-like protein
MEILGILHSHYIMTPLDTLTGLITAWMIFVLYENIKIFALKEGVSITLDPMLVLIEFVFFLIIIRVLKIIEINYFKDLIIKQTIPHLLMVLNISNVLLSAFIVFFFVSFIKNKLFINKK